MLWGRRIEPTELPWLLGPFGEVDVIADHYVPRLVEEEGLVLERHARSAGMVDDVSELLEDDAARLHPAIRTFYENTADYNMEAWSQWTPMFRPGGWLLQRLYSARFEQLNLPMRPLDTAMGISSEIALLREPSGGTIRYRLWYRTFKASGRVIFSGIYTTTRLPSGRVCVKAIYPLPRGNATIILGPRVDEQGNLELLARGRRFGEPGFYFLMRNRHHRYWAQRVRSFWERIYVYVDNEGGLRADHTMVLWGMQVMQLHYKITRCAAQEEQPLERATRPMVTGH